MSQREPQANYGCHPGRIVHRWLREAVKWQRAPASRRARCAGRRPAKNGCPAWPGSTGGCQSRSTTPRDVLADPTGAAAHAAAFRRWNPDPLNRRSQRLSDRRYQTTVVDPRLINDDLRAVAELFAFVAANRVEATRVLGPSPWQQVSEAHAASWFRQVSRIPHKPQLNAQHYVDDHALAQITAALPLLGLPREEQLLITRSDGTQVLADGFDDPQAMRMILLQILTGRRLSEIRTCAFDCLSPVPKRPVTASEDEEVVLFHYAQSKIDIAPTHPGRPGGHRGHPEQQHWIRTSSPSLNPITCSRSGS